ncbi:MAG TPA: FtsX-like permease family protein [Clostridiaceae bacterium]|nr:FtsX-like permease family protein [Clostridiaceae bacterium]
MFREILLMARGALRANKMRSFLTMLGIIVGVSAVVTILSVGQGARNLIMEQFDTVGTASSLVFSRTNVFNNDDAFTVEDLQILRQRVPNLISVAPIAIDTAQMRTARGEYAVFLFGIDENYDRIIVSETVAGRQFSPRDFDSSMARIVLSEDSAARIYGSYHVDGESVTLISGGRYLNATVIGVSHSSIQQMMTQFMPEEMLAEASAIIYVPLNSMRQLLGKEPIIMALALLANDVAEIEAVNSKSLELLHERHKSANRKPYRAMSLTDVMEQANTIINIVTIFIVAVAAISLLVGGIGVMNIMLVSVVERTREIGLRKALGATRRDILNQFIVESVILTTFGGLIGAIAGVVIANIIMFFTGLKPVFTIGSFLLAVGFSVSVGLFFGIRPAMTAAALNPIDALRNE